MSTTELSWCKSSYSGDSSGDCVEVAVRPTTWTDFLDFAARNRDA